MTAPIGHVNYTALKNAKGFLPIKVVCKILGKTPTTLWRYQQKGKIPIVTDLAGTKGWYADELRKYLDLR